MSLSPRPLLRTARRLALWACGRDPWLTPTSVRPIQRLGSPYGGWSIVPEFLKPGGRVYSFGIGEDISFDLALIETFGVELHAFDPTPRSLAWIAKQDLPPSFFVHPYGLADYDGDAHFAAPQNAAHVSFRIRPDRTSETVALTVRRLATLMAELRHPAIDLLKMDIEGSEYAALADLLQSPIRPTQILVEFHHRMLPRGAQKTAYAVSSLKRADYDLVSVSPSGEEFTFLRRAIP